MRADGGMKPISSCKKHRGTSLVFDDEPFSDLGAPLVGDLSAAAPAPVVTTFSEFVAEDPEPALAVSGVELGADNACSVDDVPGFSVVATAALLAAAEEADGTTGFEAVDESAAASAGAPLSVVVLSCGFASSALEAVVGAELFVSLVVLVAVTELLESTATVPEVLGCEGLLSGLVPAAAAVFGASSFPFDCSTLTLDKALEEPPAPDATGSL